ncbi:NAD(P)/FAD-dependent oxidoreductase [Ligilactobacillus sp. WILCCON 0076]|uniref:NAD(P)/FAD-dependent oxidoreductase n=1 Tax=Ligilactobacillus ubinensis TaxID=2876789 RepID=A0A9X2JLB1_9LACO|nr:NAD(P)/FAD-dependent oxidoreductase [Ligilactobacillus ubinensis]MCP0885871.1 NAD(P)/FAD-dependent oxidoreductase [Ligilactobacillus ubinensis]
MKQIVVLGAGYAGLKAVRSLQKKEGDFHITLVDHNDYHYEATELHEVASGTQPKTKISYPIRDVLDTKRVTFIQDSVVKINPESQSVELKNHATLQYDYAVVSLGFCSETFGIKGAKENALEMVDVPSSEKIYQHIMEMMKKYRETQDEKYLQILICGAGFTGIELAGALVDGRKDYAKAAGVSEDKIKISCVEAATRVLPMFDEKLADYGVELIKKLGVNLMTGCMIKEIKPGEVLYTKGKDDPEVNTVAAATIIWTTGVSGSQVIGESGFEQRRGRVMVNADLTAPEYPNVYIIGDVSAVMDPTSNRPYPTTAQIATRMGLHAAKNLYNQLHSKPTEAFTFHSLGTVASIGNTHALGLVGKTQVKGYPASVVKKSIMNKSLLDIGGLKELLSKGRFDLYH